MAQNVFSDFLTTFKDLTSKGLRVISESKITGGYSPANLTMQNAVTANGNGTNLNVNEYATAVLEVRGTFSATINFECSIDDTNWYPVLATKNDGTISSSCTTVGLYEIKVAAWKSICARVSNYVSGSVIVVGKVSPLVNAEKSMQLTGRKVSLPAASNLDQALNVTASGGKNTITITPPTGELWRVKYLRLNIPAPVGATGGTVHYIYLRLGANTLDNSVLFASSNYGDEVDILYNIIMKATATNGKYPTNEQTQQKAIQDLVLSQNCPLHIDYTNYTNALQSGTIKLRLIKEVEYIVS